MKTRNIVFIAASLLLAGAAAIPYLANRMVQSRIGPEHLFQISQPPAFLTESLALEQARQTLKLDGLEPSDWHPVRDGRTTAPDGRTDEFMSRNGNMQNRGVIMFTNTNVVVRFVSVKLEGKQVVCQTSIGK